MTRVKDIAALVEEVHRAYARLSPGYRAILRRAGTPDELRIEGVFWRLMEDVSVPAGDRWRMAEIVLCFDAEREKPAVRLHFARWVRRIAFSKVTNEDLPARAVRFRRLLAARNRNELVHEMRRLLRQGYQQQHRLGVDWGLLGADVFFWNEGVRRRWAEQFFSNIDMKLAPAKEATDG
jgi:CRISPR type I-E-associated protein CasB/Cse2